MLPDFDGDGLLPPGIHKASWTEVTLRLGWTEHRRHLLGGLRAALAELRDAGCILAYLDGSFVTEKQIPNDYDLCWETKGVDVKQLDPVFGDLRAPRAAQHAKYRGDLLPNVRESASGAPFVEFFQIDKTTGRPKGIIAIDPRELTT